VPIDIGRHILCLSFACVLTLWDDVESRVVSFFNLDVSQRNVCSQLAIFGIGSGKPLIAGIPRGKSSGDCSGYEKKCGYIEPVLGFRLDASLIIFGAWMASFSARDRGLRSDVQGLFGSPGSPGLGEKPHMSGHLRNYVAVCANR
jgi:hypothetical protein